MDISSDAGYAGAMARREPIAWLETLNSAVRHAGRSSGRAAGVGRGHRAAHGRDEPIRPSPAARVVRRTGIDPLPLAGHAGVDRCVPAWRTHAHDGDHRQARPTTTSLPGSRRDCRGNRLPDVCRSPCLRVRAGGGVCHDAGDGHREHLARGGAADRPRPDAARGPDPDLSYRPIEGCAGGPGPRRARRRRHGSGRACAEAARQLESAPLLRGRRRRHWSCWACRSPSPSGWRRSATSR